MIAAVNTSTLRLPMLRKTNTWYSVCDGNWNDANTWISNGLDRSVHICPRLGDNVYISHTVDYSNSLLSGNFNNLDNPTAICAFNYIIGNLFISSTGKLTATHATNQNTLIINGNLQCDGTIDLSANTNLITIVVKGITNWINNWSAGTKSTIYYYGASDYAIMPLTYYNLEIGNIGTKFLSADLTVNGTLTVDGLGTGGTYSALELSAFNLTSNITSINGKFSKTGQGTVTFTGAVNLNPAGSGGVGIVAFIGNPTVNFSGGITGDTRNGVNFGSSTMNILASQSWSFSSSGNVPSSIGTGTFLIASGVTLTLVPITGNAGGWINKGTVNGEDGTSILNVNGTYGYGNSNTVMATGVFNYNHSGTSQIYVDTGVTLTLPFTTFYDLTTYGAVALSGNTTVSHNLNLQAGSLQLSIYDFTCNGTITSSGTLAKSGSGTVNINSYSSPASLGKIDFTGNPTVNISGNIAGDVRQGLNFGAAPVNILQSLSFGVWVGGNVAPSLSASFVIASGKTFTNVGLSSITGGITTTGTITGADATAIFDNRSILTYNNTTAPMATGKLYCNQAANTFTYGLAGNQDITVPADPVSPGYKNLTLNGSGAKKLLGNISVKGTYTLTSPATLNTNGFTLTNP